MNLKKQLFESDYREMIEQLSVEMKSQFVQAQSYIYDGRKESNTKCQMLILIRHGDVLFVFKS